MNTSEQIDQIATALAAAQADLRNPVKDAANPHFKSLYADLPSGLAIVRPTLAAHGIALVQATAIDGDVMMLETRLIHKSGQWVGSFYPVIKFPAPQQQIGSALTYAKRYSMFALVGIAGADEDDDGNAASTASTPAPVKAAARLSDDQISKIDDLLEVTGSDRGRFLKFFRVGALEELPSGQFDEAIAMLEAKRAKAA